jgi:uncharacterized protein YdhG (YjbR/CyaY superfamily)
MAPKTDDGFSAEEKAAMKERAKELKAAAKAGQDQQTHEKALVEKINELLEPDHTTAAKLHELIKKNFPNLAAKTWYGMPAYNKDGKVLVFFQSGQKFGTRYCTIGFSDQAALDDGNLWPSSYALKDLTPEVEAKIISLISKAMG